MPPRYALLYCRAGFEAECAAELAEQAAARGIPGRVIVVPRSGYAAFEPTTPADGTQLSRSLEFAPLVFARQLVFAGPALTGLTSGERVAALLARARELAPRYGGILLETPDTDEAKELLGLCEALKEPLLKAARDAGLLAARPGKALPRLHVFFVEAGTAWVGFSRADNSSPWFMGIPRLRVPGPAPSRSGAKLVEAFSAFMDKNELESRLKPGMKAVDLGAAPGGWSLQLAQRGLLVTAVDNASLHESVLATGLVEHLREDGFRFRPHRPVDWLVCDMVEQPRRIAALVGDWLAQGRAREAIFNLKLPMKRRFEELRACERILERALAHTTDDFTLRFRHLYHDREEVTGYLHRVARRGIAAAPPARRR